MMEPHEQEKSVVALVGAVSPKERTLGWLLRRIASKDAPWKDGQRTKLNSSIVSFMISFIASVQLRLVNLVPRIRVVTFAF